MRHLRHYVQTAIVGALAIGCASSEPGTTRRPVADASVDASATPDGNDTPDSSAPSCACSGVEVEVREVTGTCGAYQETRVCDGCDWGLWQGQSPECSCTPGQMGESRQAEGGEGCNKGIRSETEVCNSAGTRYEWVGQGEFDGSLKDCEAGLTESRPRQGACGSYSQTRDCSQSCEPGEWGEDTSCNCTFGAGSNERACDTDNGEGCGLQACGEDNKWGSCEDNPEAPAECEPCTPVCTTAFGDMVCETERGTQNCNSGGYKLCTCQANGSWTDCATACFQ